MRIRELAALALSAALVIGCKATVEGENKAWDANVQRVNGLAALYPGFATAIQDQQKRAQDAMAQARTVGDKEQAAKQMSAANDLLSGGFVAILNGVEARQKTLRDKLVQANMEAEHGSDQAGARAAASDAQRIMWSVDSALKTGAPTADGALAVARKIDSDLTSAAANLDKVIASAKARAAADAKANAAGPAGAAGATGAGAGAAVAQWKCPYCKMMNDASRATCAGCGAAHDPGAAAKAKPAAGKK